MATVAPSWAIEGGPAAPSEPVCVRVTSDPCSFQSGVESWVEMSCLEFRGRGVRANGRGFYGPADLSQQVLVTSHGRSR